MPTRSQILDDWLGTLFPDRQFDVKPASEDASFRSYYRVTHNTESYIIMDAPPEHEDCRPFIDITRRLHACHVNAPLILEQNLSDGLLLLSDLGNDQYLKHLHTDRSDKLYKTAIDTLVRMQLLADSEGLPAYDETLLQREMNLFNDWLLKEHLAVDDSVIERGNLQTIYRLLIDNAQQQPAVFVHRDYHSRNLMVTSDHCPGVLDYQDAVTGPVSYDLVSLLKDCYIKWPETTIQQWLDYYLDQLKDSKEFKLDSEQFKRWFDLTGVQRQLKASGIFARLWHRDCKSGYLADIPRTLSYIVDLRPAYPELQPLCDLIEETVLPALEQQQ